MRENMNISVNGQSRVPPGFRFHPTEEELLQYYLRKKVANETIDLDVIFEVDLNKLEPWDIQEKCKIGTTPQNDWYFFSHKDKKYPTGTRTNRATMAGFWKATGRDKVIYSHCKRIGMRKTLVFYKGRAPHGQKSDWIMHEYRLDESSNSNNDSHVTSHLMNADFAQEEGWVVCRIFKKKNHLIKALDTSSMTTSSNMSHSSMLDSPSDNDHDDQGALDQIFHTMGSKTYHHQNNMTKTFQLDKHFMKLPSLESPHNGSYSHPIHPENDVVALAKSIDLDPNLVFNSESGIGDWATLDKLVATHLNGQTTDTTMTSIFSSSTTTVDLPDHHNHDIQLPTLRSSSSTSPGNKIYQHATTLDNYGSNEIDLWNFTRSSLQIDPLCHVSDAGV